MTQRLRRAGLLTPVWALRKEDDLGIGDTKALKEVITWAGENKIGFLQLLPINELGGDFSPYNAISSVALEPMLLDLTAIPELPLEEISHRRSLIGEDILNSNRIDYKVVQNLKYALFEIAFNIFWENGGKNNPDFCKFCQDEADWLKDYSTFRYLMDQEGGSAAWDLWSINYNTPQKAHAWIAEQGKSAEKEQAFYSWLQWHAFTQWRDLRNYAASCDVKLMGDIPIGVSYYSADVFFEPEWFNLDWIGGAPPERVFKDDPFAVKWGQNWGVPLYDWEHLEKNDFKWWKRRIDKLTDVFHIFRIDHVLGFYRFYAFPWRPQLNAEYLELDEHQAREKTGGHLPGFQPRPDRPFGGSEESERLNCEEGERYLRAIQEAAGDNEIVGEDLGVVPDYVRPNLLSLNIAGFNICHWQTFTGDHGTDHPIAGENYDECTFATYATHDHPSVPAMWEEYRTKALDDHDEENEGAKWNLRVLSEFAGIELPDDHKHYQGYNAHVKWSLLGALLRSKSRYAALMITDLFDLKDRFNIPGTIGGDNWRVRLPFTVDELKENAELNQATEILQNIIEESAR